MIQSGTIQGSIAEANRAKITHNNLHFKTKVETNTRTLIVNTYSILDRYWDLIVTTLIDHTISDIDMIKYRFNPKGLSYDLYGTTELWSLLMKANHIQSITQFTKSNIKVFNGTIFDVLNEVLILEKNEIQRNSETLM